MASKPQILLIGDSIRMGYCDIVKRELADIAEVIFPDVNCRDTSFIIESLSSWADMCDPSRVVAIHLNSGHWDAESFLGDGIPLTPLDVYARNIDRIFAYLKRRFPCAVLSYATTTPMNPEKTDGALRRTTDDLREYNIVGSKVARAAGVHIDDLFALIEGWSGECFADYCHFNSESNEIIGHTVAEFLRKVANI